MTSYRKYLLVSLVSLWMLCLTFWFWQNHYGKLGGSISLVKSMWLFTTISYFLLIPGWLWRDKRLDNMTRKFSALFFVGFLLRALIEIPLLAMTHLWRCWHGIAHDLLMLGLVTWWIIICARKNCSRLLPISLIIVLACEIWNAWMFGQIGSPQTGIYFADNSARFYFINQVTTWEVAVCLSLLCVWLKNYVKGESR